MHLRHICTGPAATGLALQTEAHFREFGIGQALFAISGSRAGENFRVVALFYPFFAQRGQAGANIYFYFGIGIRPRSVINKNG